MLSGENPFNINTIPHMKNNEFIILDLENIFNIFI
jgi:hypothetical protein